MQKWDDYRYVIALARCGSMTAAAKNLDTNTATVSRHIHRITEILNTVLFVKKKNRWELTKEGEALVEVIERFEEGLNELDQSNELALSGERHIRLSTIDFLATYYLSPNLGDLLSLAPNITTEILCSDARVSLAYGEADLSVRLTRPKEGRLIGRKVTELEFRVFRPVNSVRSEWIGLNANLDWTAEMRDGLDLMGREPFLRCHSFQAILQASLSTGMICILPNDLVTSDCGLVPVDPERPPTIREVWVVFHETRKTDPAVRVFSDWVATCFRNPPLGLPRAA